MKSNGARQAIGWALLVLGVLALVGGPGHRQSLAADPDRYISEPDFEPGDFGDLEATLEEALAGLESLEAFEDVDFEGFAENLVEQLSEALEYGAVRIDRDWPDEIRIHGDDHEFSFNSRELVREIQRMTRTVERDVMREVGRMSRDAHSRAIEREVRGRAWRVDDEHHTRREIEFEMRSLRQEMRRLERALEELERDI